MSNTFGLSASAASISTATLDSGTYRDEPFFVTGKWATRPLMCSHRSPQTSPARMAVSQENMKAWKARPEYVDRSPAASRNRSISSGDGNRSRPRGCGGFLTLARGLLRSSCHSFTAVENTPDSNAISRRTDPGATSVSRRSRHAAKSLDDTSASRLRASGSRLSFSSLICSHRTPRFFGLTSRAYLSNTSPSETVAATLSPPVMRNSSCAAQSFASCRVANIADLRTPLRATSARHLLPTFRIEATATPCVKIAYLVTDLRHARASGLAPFCG